MDERHESASGAAYADRLMQMTRRFVQRNLEPYPPFIAAVIVGSVAHHEARTDSDVDCIFVFDDVDERLVPTEFAWSFATNTYHSIFESVADAAERIQIDAKRLSLVQFADGEWDEGLRHELAACIIVSNRRNILTSVMQERLRYPETLRRERIHDHYGRADYYVSEWRLLAWIQRGGLACAHDQLTAAFEEILHLLHASNMVWMPARARWLLSALNLPCLPEGFAGTAMDILARGSLTEEHLTARRRIIAHLLDSIGSRLRAAGLLTDAAEAFRTTHPALGYAHNMVEWHHAHQEFVRTRMFGSPEYDGA